MTRRALGAVLAGGAGTRLGGAKARVELGGRPLISYPQAAVEAAGLEPVVVAKRSSDLPALGCRVIHEPEEPRHPLCGIVAALHDAGGRPVVAVGCDMPFLAPALLAWLGSAAAPPLADGDPPLPAATLEQLIVPSPGGALQPFPARYGPGLLPALERALAEESPLRATIESLAPRLLTAGELAAFGDPERLCFNVNAPEDLERARRLLNHRTATDR